MWAKMGEFMSTEPHRYFLKIIWDPGKNSIVSDIALYRGVLYGVPVYYNFKNYLCSKSHTHRRSVRRLCSNGGGQRFVSEYLEELK